MALLHRLLSGVLGDFGATLFLGAGTILGFLTFNVLFLIWLERKVSAHAQRRLGPMEVGFHGSLQTIADMLKLLSKQLVTPLATDHFTFLFAPILIFIPTICLTSLVPLGDAQAFAEMPNGLVVVVVLSSWRGGRPTTSTPCWAGCGRSRRWWPTRSRCCSPRCRSC